MSYSTPPDPPSDMDLLNRARSIRGMTPGEKNSLDCILADFLRRGSMKPKHRTRVMRMVLASVAREAGD